MPIYEYQCEACGHQEEFIQKVSDKPLTKCPACGKKKLKKQVSSTAFQLKGEGWYVTDFKNKKTPEKTTTDKSATQTASASTTEKSKPLTDTKKSDSSNKE